MILPVIRRELQTSSLSPVLYDGLFFSRYTSHLSHSFDHTTASAIQRTWQKCMPERTGFPHLMTTYIMVHLNHQAKVHVTAGVTFVISPTFLLLIKVQRCSRTNTSESLKFRIICLCVNEVHSCLVWKAICLCCKFMLSNSFF